MNNLLSIFNNGSQSWVIVLLGAVLVAYFGFKTYKSHKSGYHAPDANGKYYNTKGTLLNNGWFLMLLIAVVGILFFLWLINKDY